MNCTQIRESVSFTGIVLTAASYIFDPLGIIRLLYLVFVKVPMRTMRVAMHTPVMGYTNKQISDTVQEPSFKLRHIDHQGTDVQGVREE